jgi:hypothetical protein
MKMKRKAIASLVAATLGLSASQAVLAIPGGCPADGATPFTAGPVNPLNGFAEYVQDSTGLQLELCKDGDGATGLCFFDPVVAGNLFSQQIGFGPEAFWWLAEASVRGNVNALVVMAAEAAFATEDPAEGQQFPFTRLRIRLDVPAVGTYVVTHPYGQSTYVVDTLGAGDEVRESFDIEFKPNAVNQGRVGPWLRSVQDPDNPTDTPIPAGFIGDGAPRIAQGSPCGTNFFKIEAVSPDGGVTPAPVIDPGDSDGDGSENSFTTDLFAVFGKIWDGTFNTPVVADRASYDRPGTGGQVDAFATSVATPGAGAAATAVTVSGGPNLPADELALAGPDDAGRFSRSEVLADAATLPAHVALTASRADATTDPTTLLRHLTDVVRISKAEYNVETGLLTVMAGSSDAAANPVLTVEVFGNAVGPSGVGIPTAAPPATVTVRSARGGSDTEPVTVVAAAPPANRPPFATGDSATTDEDTAVTIDVLANDGDSDGDPITVFAVRNAQNGTVVNNGASVTFTPAPNYFGNGASFEYRVSDGRGGLSDYALVTVNVLPVNDPPVAVNDSAETLEDFPLVMLGADLVANDIDVDGDALTVTAVGNPVNGLVTLDLATDTVTFTPATNYSGPASFQYTVSDGNGGSAVGTVSVTVVAVNDAPVARNDSAATAFETPVIINVLANDSDPEGSALTVASVGTPANGTAVNNGSSITYTPNTGFSGIDSFTYVARDADGALSNSATVTVSVAAPAQVVDLDINRLAVTNNVRLARNQQVGITLRVQNGGSVDAPRTATVTGTMNGVEVYRQSRQVSDPVGGGFTNWSFPSFTPTTTGTINWRAEIFDDNPDVDVATATTTVQ